MQTILHQWIFERTDDCSKIRSSVRPMNLMATWPLEDGKEKRDGVGQLGIPDGCGVCLREKRSEKYPQGER